MVDFSMAMLNYQRVTLGFHDHMRMFFLEKMIVDINMFFS